MKIKHEKEKQSNNESFIVLEFSNCSITATLFGVRRYILARESFREFVYSAKNLKWLQKNLPVCRLQWFKVYHGIDFNNLTWI